MWETAIAIAVIFAVAVRLVLLVVQWRQQSAAASLPPDSGVPLVFPQGCVCCRHRPVVVPWVYTESPEAFSCSQCQTSFLIHFVPGGIGVPPQYEWREQNPRGAMPKGGAVCNCPRCRGELTYYLERRPNSPREATARCRSCGFSEAST